MENCLAYNDFNDKVEEVQDGLMLARDKTGLLITIELSSVDEWR